ncbi:S-layer homology domain-containing protein [Domibacillus indicus]|uniref:S-layer homology domain-containing protein n=1 Tax=Domibacillus indicus TaxID=1437523 RepID=UPI000617C6A2
MLVCCFFFFTSSFAFASFNDVSKSHWAKDEITYLFGQKIINGFANGIRIVPALKWDYHKESLAIW